MISPEHLKTLAASGITEQFALARGYETITDPKRLANLVNGTGITPKGRSVPGLLVPMLRADGSTVGYQYRPDNPRLTQRQAVKYETPMAAAQRARRAARCRRRCSPTRTIPLWVTEGCKKADCGAARAFASSHCRACGTGCHQQRRRQDGAARVA